MLYTIWLTTACNLKCKYCYEGMNKNHISIDKKMAEDIVEYIAKTSANDKELNIDFHGGEVFLNYDILKILISMLDERFPDKSKRYGLTTNATLLNDESIQYVSEHIRNVSVSIDGIREKHNESRPFKDGRGSYDKAMENSLKLLDKFKERLRVRMTFMPSMVSGLADDIKDLYDKGFKTIAALPDIFNKTWDESDFINLSKEIEVMKNVIKKDDEIYFNLMEPLSITKKGSCMGGVMQVDIYPDGSLYPCTMAAGIDEFKIGDIFKGKDDEKVKKILSNSSEKIAECDGCNLYRFCECNRCRIINKLTTGSYIEPNNVQCVYNNTLINTNGYLLC